MAQMTIGVFDSGLGGLTAVKALRELQPKAELIYFGDTGRMPYGGRSREELIKMAFQNVDFLKAQGAQAILAACGTVSSTVLPEYGDSFGVPVYGVVTPAAKKAAEISGGRAIGVLATEATVKSGAFVSEIKKFAPNADVRQAACPKLVPLIEAGKVSLECEDLRKALCEYLEQLGGAEVIILGCTHYPMLKDAINTLTGGSVLIDVGREAARALSERFEVADGVGGLKLFTSGDREIFEKTASDFLKTDLSGKVFALDPLSL